MLLLAAVLLVSIDLLELHGPDGQTVYISTHEINSLRQPRDFDLRRHFATGTKCIVLTTDGKFISVVESCQTIIARIKESNHAK